MSSLVSDFIINPVLRQARRFSEASRPATANSASGDEATATPPPPVAVIESDSEQQHNENDHVTESDRIPSESAMQTPSSTRPLSSSTQDTRIDEPPAGPVVIDETPRDHLGFPLSPSRKGHGIPEDDGMRTLRSRIHEINSRSIPQSAKARLIHDALLERYRASQGVASAKEFDHTEPLPAVWETSTSPPVGTLDSLKFWQAQLGEVDSPESFLLSKSDKAPTFAPIRRSKSNGVDTPATGATTPTEAHAPLGCQHYERNVKLQCSTCKKWYTCRFCHDAAEDHTLIRKETKNMLCMLCATPQRASEVCISCGELSAQYYCNICKLWENRQNKPIYHCGDCGICRRGLGLGKDFFHCKICSACIPTSIESSHKCIERSTDCDCPICGEYMFTSPKPVVFMTCGHSIHKKCYDQHLEVSYKCPICNKSLANMETQFRNLDLLIQGQPMPSEFRDTKALILCNDCSGKCTVPYHWLGLKCSICRSYNTVELQILGGDTGAIQAAANRDHTPAPVTASVSSTAVTQSREVPVRPPPVSAISAAPSIATEPTIIPNRRRHSSHGGTELTHRISDRFARSLSPYIGTEMHMGNFNNLGQDSDSEDEMLGFWSNLNGGEADVQQQAESESDSDGDSQMSDVEEEDEDEDEEEDENEIFLIGHR